MSRLTSMFAALALWLTVTPFAASRLASPLNSIDHGPFFDERFVPFIKEYCVSCHGGAKPKADLDFARLTREADLLKGDVPARAILQHLKDRTMPPAKKPQPKDSERRAIVAGLEKLLRAGAPSGPGRITIRRLNRAEYNNTVRDLLGVDFKPADDFPSDDVGYGFDHIGDVLTLSPLLLEKYLRAAERITAAALTLPPAPRPEVRRVVAKEFKAEPTTLRIIGEGRYRALEKGTLRAAVSLPEGGKYRLKLHALAEQAGEEKPRLTLRVDGEVQSSFTVSAPSPRGESFTHSCELAAGERFFEITFENSFTEPPPERETKDSAEGQPKPAPQPKVRRIGIEFLEVEGPLDRPPPPPPESYRRFFTIQPSAELPPRAAARKLIEPLAERAYRRPVATEEIEKLLRIFDLAQAEKETFEHSVRLVVQALLVSPHFLFRVELRATPLRAGEVEALESYALASRVSYFLWSSMPDDELFQLAMADQLRDPAVLEAQVRRMLKSPKAHALTENFAGQWLQLRSLASAAPDSTRFPGFDEELRIAMRKESELFFQTILAENRPIGDFLTADFTFLNERLAKHYGIDGVKGSEFRRVSLKGQARGGLITQASMLTITSNPTRTSPVKRGKWILENLLASPPPPPPPGAGDLSEDEHVVLSGSLRQRMEQHRAKLECAVCHERLDPLGFGLENYDAIGRWRDRDGTFPIDATGTLPDGQSFRNVGELKAVLRDRLPDFRRCLCEKMLTYALGRGLEPTDEEQVARLAEALQKKDDRFAELLVEVVKSEAFRFRQPAPE
jgi:hypothetical protein